MSFKVYQNNIVVEKTARYFCSSNDFSKAPSIWIVLHGYAQLADEFLQLFSSFFSDKVIVIAPEGLHRFYKKGGTGDVAAGWMTKTERANDIKDYCYYLDKIIEQCHFKSHQQINVLGFSQGSATLARWVNQSKFNFNKLVFYAGVFPPDLSTSFSSKNWRLAKIYAIIGNNDRYYTVNDFFTAFNELESKTLVQRIIFTGLHEIKNEGLLEVFTE